MRLVASKYSEPQFSATDIAPTEICSHKLPLIQYFDSPPPFDIPHTFRSIDSGTISGFTVYLPQKTEQESCSGLQATVSLQFILNSVQSWLAVFKTGNCEALSLKCDCKQFKFLEFCTKLIVRNSANRLLLLLLLVVVVVVVVVVYAIYFR